MIVNVELKGTKLKADGLEAAVIRAVESTGMQERVILSSFNPIRLWRSARLNPDIERGLLYTDSLPIYLRRAWFRPLVRPAALHPMAELRAGGAGCIDTGFVSKVSDGAEESCFVGVVLMSAIPTGLRWRRFVCLLRDLVYRPLKSHRASLRQLFSPIHSANQNLISRASCRRHPAQSHLVRLIPQTSTQPG